jgi:hypothetical protein
VFADERRALARQRIGAANDDIVVMFLGRLSFHAKAHPQAMYLALEQVTQKFPGRRIHLLQCGWFANVAIEEAFREGAHLLCPSVAHHFVDGRDTEARDDAWASADIYVSLSDNIQETFGLSPVEAMAAGLPVVATDWDGYRDTIRDGIDGFRVPTLMPGAPDGVDLAMRYDAGIDSYDMYCGLTCELVAVDVKATAQAIAQLVADPVLRRRMGDAGRARVSDVFDWRIVLGRYRELWSELDKRRPTSADFSQLSSARPDRLDPFLAFSDYPTRVLDGQDRLSLVFDSPERACRELEQRRGLKINSFARVVFPEASECQRVIERVAAAPGMTVDQLVSEFPPFRQRAIRRGLVWMMKMNVISFPRTR